MEKVEVLEKQPTTQQQPRRDSISFETYLNILLDGKTPPSDLEHPIRYNAQEQFNGRKISLIRPRQRFKPSPFRRVAFS